MQFHRINDLLTITRSNELILNNTSAPFDLSTRTDGLILSTGTTAQRPSDPVVGTMRLNTSLYQPEVFTTSGWSAIDVDLSIMQSASPTTLSNVGDTTTITGQGFVPDMVFEFVGATDAIYLAPSWSLINSTTVIVQRPNVLPQSEEPFSIRVTMPDGPQYTLRDVIDVGESPIFVSPTPAAGSLGSHPVGSNLSFTFVAQDLDGSNLMSISVDTTIPGFTYSFNGLSSAVLSGTTSNVAANTTYNFSVSAMDLGSNVTTRQYSLTVVPFVTSVSFYPTAAQPTPLTYATGTTQADGKSHIRVNDSYWQLTSVQSGSLYGMYAYLYWSDVSLGSRFQVQLDVLLTGKRGGYYADAIGIFAYGTADKIATNTGYNPDRDTGGYQVTIQFYDYNSYYNTFSKITRGGTVLLNQPNSSFPKETWTPVVFTFNDGVWSVTVNSVTFASYTDSSQPGLYSNTYFGVFGSTGYDETNIRIRNLRVNQI